MSAEYGATQADIVLMSSLGKYYAAKIRGATELALFRETLRDEHRTKAGDHMSAAWRSWRQYSQRARESYKNPLWTNRVGIVDWTELDAEVQGDIAIANGNP
jgi:hypothetical protein